MRSFGIASVSAGYVYGSNHFTYLMNLGYVCVNARVGVPATVYVRMCVCAGVVGVGVCI